MYSFDIFDTLLTRSTATFDGIFLIMENYLAQRPEEYTVSLQKNFYRLRMQSESLARSLYCKGDVEEITLRQIYQTMALMGGIKTEEIGKLKKLEEEIEIENVVGIRENIEKVRKLISLKERVVAISDMYLEGDIIRRMFDKAGIPSIPIYVSSETHLCKWTGNMFRYVMRKEGVPYRQWHHMGDHIDSDYTIPRQYGISAKHYPFPQPNQADQELLKQNHVEVQLLLGTVKNRMLNEPLPGYSAWGAKIAALVFYPYVSWLLNICLEKNIRHLYFVHRHGDILKKICERITEEEHCEIETDYLEQDAGSLKDGRDNALVCLTNDRGTRQILQPLLQKQESKIRATFCYFVKDIEENDIYHYIVYTCLNDSESNILCGLSRKYQNKNGDCYPRGGQAFADSISGPGNLEKWNGKRDIPLLYLKELLTSEENETVEFVRSLQVQNAEEDDTKTYGIEPISAVYALREHDRLVIYGAGNLGRHIYSQILKKNQYQIVLWADRWYEDCASRGLNVDNPKKITETKFDFIVIAVVDEYKARDIKQHIRQMGVEESKILWINSYDAF